MSDDLTSDQIALLCDIEEHDLFKLTEEKRDNLEQLLFDGYLEPATKHPGSALELTAKALKFLGERGAGLDEA